MKKEMMYLIIMVIAITFIGKVIFFYLDSNKDAKKKRYNERVKKTVNKAINDAFEKYHKEEKK